MTDQVKTNKCMYCGLVECICGEEDDYYDFFVGDDEDWWDVEDD